MMFTHQIILPPLILCFLHFLMQSAFQGLIFNFCIEVLKKTALKNSLLQCRRKNLAILPATDLTTSQAIYQSWALGHPPKISKSECRNTT